MWMNGSRSATSTPANARRTGKPSPSKPLRGGGDRAHRPRVDGGRGHGEGGDGGGVCSDSWHEIEYTSEIVAIATIYSRRARPGRHVASTVVGTGHAHDGATARAPRGGARRDRARRSAGPSPGTGSRSARSPTPCDPTSTSGGCRLRSVHRAHHRPGDVGGRHGARCPAPAARRPLAGGRPLLRRRDEQLAVASRRRLRRVGGVRPPGRIGARPRRAGRDARGDGGAAPPGRHRARRRPQWRVPLGRPCVAAPAARVGLGRHGRGVRQVRRSRRARDAARVRRARPRRPRHRGDARVPARRAARLVVRRAPGGATAAAGDAPGRPRPVAPHPVADRRGGAVRRHRRAHPDRRPPGAECPTPSSRCRGCAARGTRRRVATASTTPRRR